jgi:hypothetical protein
MLYDFRGKCKNENPPIKCAEEIFLGLNKKCDSKLTKEEFIEGRIHFFSCIENLKK